MDTAALDALFREAAAAHARGDLAAAERLCRAIIGADPGHRAALFALASLEFARGDLAAAEAHAAQIIALDPADAEALNLRATALAGLKRNDEAAACFGRAAALTSDPAPALYNQGTLLHELGRFEEALRCYDAALAHEPRDAVAQNNRGNALRALNRLAEALAAYDRVLTLDPGYADAWNNRGTALHGLGRSADALASYDRAIALAPGLADAYYNRGIALAKLDRLDAALASHNRAVTLRPDHAEAASHAFALSASLCDWRDRARRSQDLVARIRAGQPVSPFVVLGMSDDPTLQEEAAATSARSLAALAPASVARAARTPAARIRLAYLSADFRNHVVGHVLVSLFERSDRARFELHGVSLASAPDSGIRRRLVAAFDHFIDAARMSDAAVATLLRARGIDIAIDLMGYTEGGRGGIFAHRAAPLQVNYFGYPGTTGASYIDYLIADRTVVSSENRTAFSEKIVYLPESYYPATPEDKADLPPPPRRALGLPETGFVFCNFNASYKITPEIFAVWMRLLGQIEGSVLWLYAGAAAQTNLRREAAAQGIAPERLIFAAPAERGLHLARLPCADLALDTLPYNAHTTATEALWAGLPLITCIGRAFPARVAASVLQAAGLPELITSSFPDYEALALKLARSPTLLAALRTKLTAQRNEAPLFDADRYRRHLEAAFAAMWARHEAGETPQDFAIEPLQ